MKRLLLIWVALWGQGALICYSQDVHFSYILSSESDPVSVLKPTPPPTFADSISLERFLVMLRLEMISDGYLEAGVDSVAWVGDSARAHLHLGRQYKWAVLRPGNVPEEYLSRTGFREKLFTGQPITPASMGKLFERLLRHCENNGFPFAELSLDSIEIYNATVSAMLNLNTYEYTVVDSIIVKGNIKTSLNFVEKYLSVSKGMPYNQALLDNIPKRLREIPFAQVIKPYEIGMRPGKADVYLYLNNRPASNLDGILGIQPDNITGNVVLTGDVQFNIMNGLRQGETLNLRWQRLQANTPQLDLRFEYPYMLRTPLGTEFKLNVYRRDTLFSQLGVQGAVQYYFKGQNSIKLFFENDQTNVIAPSAFQIDRFADTRINMFGAGFTVRSLDYRFNPRRGYEVESSIAVGNRRILVNQGVDQAVYEGLELNTEIYSALISGREFFPIGKRSTLMARVKGGALVNPNMFRNESFRIGGLKSIRGFDEQSIFATSYAIGTLEFRYLLEQNSNLFIFLDQGYFEDRFGTERFIGIPTGFGTGLSFETRAGIFSLTYALGRQEGANVSLRGAKLHFGFSSLF